LSAVAINWSARWLLVMAFCTLTMSLRSTSLAIKTAGSSLPVLIRKPVLKQFKAFCKSVFDLAKVVWAIKELTLELIRVMPDTPSKLVNDQVVVGGCAAVLSKRRRRQPDEVRHQGSNNYPSKRKSSLVMLRR